MKILGLKNSSGSSFHRILLPLSYLGADFTDTLVEEVIKNYQVLWLHYSTKVSSAQLGIWKAKYGLQIIVDMDDSWQISRNHISYKSLLPVIQRSKELVVLADKVICSTKEVEQEVKVYNKETIVVGNGIPWNEGQFQVYDEPLQDFLKRKIRIGFVGSASHHEDWLSIKGQMRRCLSDGEIKQCEFVVCGVPTNIPIPDWMNKHPQKDSLYKNHVRHNKEIWTDICKVLGSPKIVSSRNSENYIKLYREIDILLSPLVNNQANICRSNLKVLECACTNTVPILGNLYKNKSELNSVHLYEDWYKNIKMLIRNKEELYKRKLEVSKYVRNNHNYYEECIQPRIDFLQEPIKHKEINIWGITYKEDQFTEYNRYRNPVNTLKEKSWLFEWNPILKISEQW